MFFTFGNIRKLKLEKVKFDGDDVIDDEFVELIYRRVYKDGGFSYVLDSRKVVSNFGKYSFRDVKVIYIPSVYNLLLTPQIVKPLMSVRLLI